MQLLKWLRQEGALPRDLAYPLEDAEESLADFFRLQRVLKEHTYYVFQNGCWRPSWISNIPFLRVYFFLYAVFDFLSQKK